MIGQRIIITEKSIVNLRGLEVLKGKCTFGMEFMYNAQKNALRQLSFKNYTTEKKEYKSKDLYDNLRIWHKIILGCINPRPPTSSLNYFNII